MFTQPPQIPEEVALPASVCFGAAAVLLSANLSRAGEQCARPPDLPVAASGVSHRARHRIHRRVIATDQLDELLRGCALVTVRHQSRSTSPGSSRLTEPCPCGLSALPISHDRNAHSFLVRSGARLNCPVEFPCSSDKVHLRRAPQFCSGHRIRPSPLRRVPKSSSSISTYSATFLFISSLGVRAPSRHSRR